ASRWNLQISSVNALFERTNAMWAISTTGLKRVAKSPEGATPMLQWIAIHDLVVNHSYQREVSSKSRRNIVRIAENFRWSFFAPVVVAPI
ncbi:hypothetical protein, partial [Lacticaseibacillus rhamnosus]|uniref:hypothetical protein n=1 Tax=Lacticaseibacillus rhamnosus TaxID=47715 RepID=UPI003F47E0DD